MSGHCDSCGNVQCLCHLIVADLKAEIRTLRSAFDDRVKVIRLQLADKEALQAELRAAQEERDQAREEAVHQNDLLKAAQERAETAERERDFSQKCGADAERKRDEYAENWTLAAHDLSKLQAEHDELERDYMRAVMAFEKSDKAAEALAAQQAATIARIQNALTATCNWLEREVTDHEGNRAALAKYRALADDPPAPLVSAERGGEDRE